MSYRRSIELDLVGTYVRTRAIDTLVWRFLSVGHGLKKQIVSLGAGSDTRYFRLQTDMSLGPQSFVYHELDFAENTAGKIKTILSVKNVNECIQEPLDISADGTKLHSPNYHIHPVDLRSLATRINTPMGTAESIDLKDLDVSLPTLLISECCLVYLEPTAADAVLDYFTHLFLADVPLGLIIYEPVNPFDSFGEVMVSNLAARGIVLQTLQKYHSLNLQTARLKKEGLFSNAAAADVGFLWDKWVSADEKERVAVLEMVDEIEEWRLLAQHYCVVWGWRGDHDSVWERWKELESSINVVV